MTCDSLQERAGRGLSDDTNHVAVRAHGEATEANKDRRHQNLSAPDILIFNTNFPPPKMYECARLQNVRVGEICVKTTSPHPPCTPAPDVREDLEGDTELRPDVPVVDRTCLFLSLVG